MNDERILIAYFGRGLGGIQVKIMDLAYALAQKNIPCRLLVRKRTQIFATPTPKNVRVVDLSLPGSIFAIPTIILGTAKAISDFQPTKVLAFADHTALIVLLIKKLMFWKNFQVVISEDIFLSKYLSEQNFGPIRKRLISLLYPLADRIAVLSTVYKTDLVKNFCLPSNKIFVYKNWLSPRQKKGAIKSKKDIDVLFVGRLEKQKRLNLFLRIVKRVKESHPRLRIVLVGDGARKEMLKKEVSALGLQNNVSFPGYQRDPIPFYHRAKVFLLTSCYEGEPLVFLEAVYAGTPIVSLAYTGLSGGLLIDGKTGFIARNENEAAEKVIKLLDNEGRAKVISSAAKKYLKEKYKNNLQTALTVLFAP